MNDLKEKSAMPHSLIMKERNELSVTGVTDVDSFDDTSIVAYTNCGELTISGSNLRINSLNTDVGELSVAGEIASLVYLENQPKAAGFFSKIFR